MVEPPEKAKRCSAARVRFACSLARQTFQIYFASVTFNKKHISTWQSLDPACNAACSGEQINHMRCLDVVPYFNRSQPDCPVKSETTLGLHLKYNMSLHTLTKLSKIVRDSRVTGWISQSYRHQKYWNSPRHAKSIKRSVS